MRERERDREWEREGRDTVMPGDRKSMVSIERNGRYSLSPSPNPKPNPKPNPNPKGQCRAIN